MGRLSNLLLPIPTYPKQTGRKLATTDWAHRVGSSCGLITIVVMILFVENCSIVRPCRRRFRIRWPVPMKLQTKFVHRCEQFGVSPMSETRRCATPLNLMSHTNWKLERPLCMLAGFGQIRYLVMYTFDLFDFIQPIDYLTESFTTNFHFLLLYTNFYSIKFKLLLPCQICRHFDPGSTDVKADIYINSFHFTATCQSYGY